MAYKEKDHRKGLEREHPMWLIGKRPWERLREGYPMVCIITGRIVYQPFSRLRLRVE